LHLAQRAPKPLNIHGQTPRRTGAVAHSFLELFKGFLAGFAELLQLFFELLAAVEGNPLFDG